MTDFAATEPDFNTHHIIPCASSPNNPFSRTILIIGGPESYIKEIALFHWHLALKREITCVRYYVLLTNISFSSLFS